MGKKLTVKVWMVMGAAVMVLGGAASARADQEVVARVPFDFIAGGVRLPAGTYVVTQQDQPSLVSIEHRPTAFRVRSDEPDGTDRAGSESKLVFERVGPEHFLSQVVGEGKEGLELLQTPADMERELERLTPASVQ